MVIQHDAVMKSSPAFINNLIVAISSLEQVFMACLVRHPTPQA